VEIGGVAAGSLGAAYGEAEHRRTSSGVAAGSLREPDGEAEHRRTSKGEALRN